MRLLEKNSSTGSKVQTRMIYSMKMKLSETNTCMYSRYKHVSTPSRYHRLSIVGIIDVLFTCCIQQ